MGINRDQIWTLPHMVKITIKYVLLHIKGWQNSKGQIASMLIFTLYSLLLTPCCARSTHTQF